MTIGADMPLRSQFDALVRDKGKDDHTPDQKSARGKDTPTDFKSMVKAAAPKLKLDKDDTTLEEESGDAVESDKDKGIPASAPSGAFGQAILAFEQLLERQRRENGDRTPRVNQTRVLPEADAVAASVEIGATGLESEQQDPASAPDEKTERQSVRTAKMAVEFGASVAQTGQALTKPDPESKPVVEQNVPSAEAPKNKAVTKVAVEKPSSPVADAATSTSSLSVQAEAKLGATAPSNGPPVQTAARPHVTGVLVLSERTGGATKTLVIQLQPIELGTVTARMRLTPEGMHIQLMAENKEMAEHLASDHDALGKALQRAGVADDASSVTISVIDRSSASSNAQTGQQSLTGQEQQASGQAHSGFQGTPGERSTSQQPFGEVKPDDREEVSAKAGVENRSSRGLVV